MAIMNMYEKISGAVDNKEFSVGVFIDLSKAFDTLNHDILLNKLEFYGVRGITLELFKSYLNNRRQFVFYNGASSCLKQIVCGVPQGSILGPLLFILYINDIVNCSNILAFILFADDTNLFYYNRMPLNL
jgi:retron-type reverse transcriptase